MIRLSSASHAPLRRSHHAAAAAGAKRADTRGDIQRQLLRHGRVWKLLLLSRWRALGPCGHGSVKWYVCVLRYLVLLLFFYIVFVILLLYIHIMFIAAVARAPSPPPAPRKPAPRSRITRRRGHPGDEHASTVLDPRGPAAGPHSSTAGMYLGLDSPPPPPFPHQVATPSFTVLFISPRQATQGRHKTEAGAA